MSPPPFPPHTLPLTRPDTVTYHIPTHLPLTSSSTPITPPPPLKTTIHLPPHSSWTSALHFHPRHTEYLRLVRGAIYARVGSRRVILSTAAGCAVDAETGAVVEMDAGFGMVVEVPRGTVHEWQRAEAFFELHHSSSQREGGHHSAPEDVEDDVVVEEWTAPHDASKPVFFANLHAIIVGGSSGPVDAGLRVKLLRWMLGSWWVEFQLWVLFWEADNWPVVWDFEGVLGKRVGMAVGRVVAWVVFVVVRAVAWGAGLEGVEKGRTPGGLWEAWVEERKRESGGLVKME